MRELAGEYCTGDAAYVLGVLSPDERRDFEDHLLGCDRCQESVAGLAGLPSLLALVDERDLLDQEQGAAGPDPDPIPALVSEVTRLRRRRRLVTGGGILAAAVAVTIAAIGLLRPVPAATGSAAPAGSPVALEAVSPVPLTVSLRLDDRAWGTSITVICTYPSGGYDDGRQYKLTVIDRAGHVSDAGSWWAVAGTSAMATATSVHAGDIGSIEVRTPDGQPLLRAVR